jgi:hypothetical protein
MMFQNMTVNHLAFAKGKTPSQNFFLVLKKVTGILRERSISASSIPIKPPPTITARFVVGAALKLLNPACDKDPLRPVNLVLAIRIY